MLRKIAFVTAIFFFSLAPLGSRLAVQAQTANNAPEAAPQSQSIFRTGNEVVIEGEQFGHVYAAAGQVVVRGVIHGDLVAAGGSVRIEGTVTQDVYAAAGSLVISGDVQGQVTAAAGESVLTAESEVGKGVVLAGESVRLFGEVQEPSMVRARRLENSASISGDLAVWKKEQPQTDQVAPLVNSIIHTLSNVLFALIAWWWFGPALRATTQRLREDWRSAATAGIVMVVTVPLFMLLLLITLVGAPVGFKIGMAYFALLSVASVVPTFWIGQRLFAKAKPVWQLVAGAVMIGVLTQLPIIGWMIAVVLATVGAGAILKMLRSGV